MLFGVDINPIPWKTPTYSVGRRAGKAFVLAGRNEDLANYKEAVAEALRKQGAQMFEAPYSLRFYFWRQETEYKTTKGRKQSMNAADATNMQKATEDALQGILIDNDRHVIHVSSTIMASGADVEPFVVIDVRNHHDEPRLTERSFADEYAVREAMLEEAKAKLAASNTWL